MKMIEAVRRIRSEEEAKFNLTMTELVIEELSAGFPLLLSIRPLYFTKELVNIARFMDEPAIYRDVVMRPATIRVKEKMCPSIYRNLDYEVVNGDDPLENVDDSAFNSILEYPPLLRASQYIVLEMASYILGAASLSKKPCEDAYRSKTLGLFHDCWVNSLKQIEIVYIGS